MDRSVSGWTNDRKEWAGWAMHRSAQPAPPLCIECVPPVCTGSWRRGSPSNTLGALSHAGPCPWCRGSEAPSPIPLKAQSLLQTCPGSLTDAVSSARCPVVGGQDNKFCFVSKQMREGGPLRGPQYAPWGGQLSCAALSSSRPRVSLRAPGRSGTRTASQPCWAGSEVSKSGPQNCSSIQVQGSQPLRTKSTLYWTPSPPGPGSSKYPQVDTFLPLDG